MFSSDETQTGKYLITFRFQTCGLEQEKQKTIRNIFVIHHVFADVTLILGKYCVVVPQSQDKRLETTQKPTSSGIVMTKDDAIQYVW